MEVTRTTLCSNLLFDLPKQMKHRICWTLWEKNIELAKHIAWEKTIYILFSSFFNIASRRLFRPGLSEAALHTLHDLLTWCHQQTKTTLHVVQWVALFFQILGFHSRLGLYSSPGSGRISHATAKWTDAGKSRNLLEFRLNLQLQVPWILHVTGTLEVALKLPPCQGQKNKSHTHSLVVGLEDQMVPIPSQSSACVWWLSSACWGHPYQLLALELDLRLGSTLGLVGRTWILEKEVG